MEFRSAYSPKTRVQLFTPEPSRTKQAFKAECDINTIIARYLRTGQIDLAQRLEPRYGDCTGLEFQAAMLTVKQAQTLFAELPSAIRSRFRNEPGEFLNFVQDEKNREEAQKLGLLKPEAPRTEPAPAPAPSPASSVAPATA